MEYQFSFLPIATEKDGVRPKLVCLSVWTGNFGLMESNSHSEVPRQFCLVAMRPRE